MKIFICMLMLQLCIDRALTQLKQAFSTAEANFSALKSVLT